MRRARTYQFKLLLGTEKRKRKCQYCQRPISSNKKVKTCGSSECKQQYFDNKLGPKPVRRCAHCARSFTCARSNKKKYCSYDCHLDSGGARRAGLASAKALKRYGQRKDANHNEIVNALKAGCVGVFDASNIGGGFPDLICNLKSETYLVEIKNEKTSYGRRGLNENQKLFAESWSGGPVYIVKNLDDVELFINGRLEQLYAYGGWHRTNVEAS